MSEAINVHGCQKAWRVRGQGPIPALFVTSRTKGLSGGSGSLGTCPGNSSSMFPQGAMSCRVSHRGGETNRYLSPARTRCRGSCPEAVPGGGG